MLDHSRFSIFIFLVLLSTAFSSCTSTQYISSNPFASEEITRGSETDYAFIALHDGRSVRAYHVAVRSDSTEWYSENRTLRHAEATSAIQSISILTPDITDGIIVGALIGALPALLVGALSEPYTSWFGGTITEAEKRANTRAFWEGFLLSDAPFVLLGALGGSQQRTEYKIN